MRLDDLVRVHSSDDGATLAGDDAAAPNLTLQSTGYTVASAALSVSHHVVEAGAAIGRMLL